jgi:hypothetical protein
MRDVKLEPLDYEHQRGRQSLGVGWWILFVLVIVLFAIVISWIFFAATNHAQRTPQKTLVFRRSGIFDRQGRLVLSRPILLISN